MKKIKFCLMEGSSSCFVVYNFATISSQKEMDIEEVKAKIKKIYDDYENSLDKTLDELAELLDVELEIAEFVIKVACDRNGWYYSDFKRIPTDNGLNFPSSDEIATEEKLDIPDASIFVYDGC